MDHVGEFRIEHGTKFYIADGVRVAKKVGDDWVTIVDGWVVEDGWSAGDKYNGPVTMVSFEGNMWAKREK